MENKQFWKEAEKIGNEATCYIRELMQKKPLCDFTDLEKMGFLKKAKEYHNRWNEIWKGSMWHEIFEELKVIKRREQGILPDKKGDQK